MMRTKILFMFGILALVLSACTSDAGTSIETPTGGMGGMSGDGGMGDGFAFGEPGDPNMVNRTIDITQSDMLWFSPESVKVNVGDTVRFVVSNEGQTNHEFIIGDIALQDQHESEMREGGGMMMPNEPNAVSLAPGQSIEVVWKFTSPGTYVYGCHFASHFAGGMQGEIRVTQ